MIKKHNHETPQNPTWNQRLFLHEALQILTKNGVDQVKSSEGPFESG